jgi:hypothetical protein
MPKITVAEALRKHHNTLTAIPCVVGVGKGPSGGEACVRIFVAGEDAETTKTIPADREGHSVVFEESGEFPARNSSGRK